jgi:hypothetical protein
MISHELDTDAGILTVRPEGPLSGEDFKSLAAAVDPYIQELGSLKALIINVENFPGWENLVGMIEHFRFVKGHHQDIGKVALVTDSKLVAFMPKIVEHFVNADVAVFPFGKLDEAKVWAGGRI